MFRKIILLTITLLLNSTIAQEIISREERCLTAKQNLEKLSDISKPIYAKAYDGTVRELTYQEIVNAREDNQNLVNSFCSISVQPSVNPQYATRAAEIIAPQSSPAVALRNALLSGDWAEVEVILVYVMLFDDATTQKIIDFAKSHSTDDTLEYVNKAQSINVDKEEAQNANNEEKNSEDENNSEESPEEEVSKNENNKDVKNKKGKTASDSSKNERHGNSKALEQAEKQIEELKNELKKAKTKAEKNKIQRKINNIRKNAQRNKKGETHSMKGKGK